MSARRQGFSEEFNSRMGVGPIETLGKYGLETGGSTRNWSLMGEINQKQTRLQDKPIKIENLSDESKSIIRAYYPMLFGKKK